MKSYLILFSNFFDQSFRVPFDLRVDEQNFDWDGHLEVRQLELGKLDEPSERGNRIVDAGRSPVKDLLRDKSESVKK